MARISSNRPSHVGHAINSGAGGDQTLTSGTSVAWDWSQGSRAKITLGHNVATFTLTLPPGVTAAAGTLLVIQDGTGSRTLAEPAGAVTKTAGGTAITITAAANSQDLLDYYTPDAGVTYYVSRRIAAGA